MHGKFLTTIQKLYKNEDNSEFTDKHPKHLESNRRRCNTDKSKSFSVSDYCYHVLKSKCHKTKKKRRKKLWKKSKKGKLKHKGINYTFINAVKNCDVLKVVKTTHLTSSCQKYIHEIMKLCRRMHLCNKPDTH